MTPSKRLRAEERRRVILEAAIPLFADKGFEAVTTRELAEASGVTEPVLYRHFPSKAALYLEIQRHVDSPEDHSGVLRSFEALPASTEKLVMGLHLFITHVVLDIEEQHKVFPRLMLRSLLDDGAFARSNLRGFETRWFQMLSDSLAAARRAGDATDTGVAPKALIWLAHHVAFGAKALALPTRAVVDYGISRARLAHETVVFALRGIGVTESALTRCLKAAASPK